MKCVACNMDLFDNAVFCTACGTRQPGASEQANIEYAAFISYRHRSPDRKVARKIHRAIEAYRLPASVAHAYGSHHVGKAFRDDEELSATTHLPNAIRKAIKQSSALVVVCSPTTKDSMWVAREIELFAAYHGHERIFAAIAEGSSSESIPPQLREQPVIDNSGAISNTVIEPLAVDYREESQRTWRAETLKLIAALLNCPYDELARRNRTRKVQRFAIGAIAVLCIVSALSIFALQAAHNREAALLSESVQLAAQSREELAHGNRYEAIETALSALPESSLDASRPVSPEAIAALEEALGVVNEHSDPWHACYSATTETGVSVIGETSMLHRADSAPERIGSISVHESGRYFAVLDDSDSITTFSLTTGKKLACITPEITQANPTLSNMACAENLLFVGRAGENGSLACYDPHTGGLVWQQSVLPTATLSLSPDESTLGVVSIDANGKIYTTLLDTATGTVLTSTSTSLAHPISLSYGIKSTMDAADTSIYTAAEGQLIKTTGENETLKQVALAYPEIASLEYFDNMVIVASVEQYDNANLELAYCIEAFNGNLERRWEHRGTLASQMMINDDFTSLILGWPSVCAHQTETETLIIATAGRSFLALSSSTGDVCLEQNYANTVIAAFPVVFNGTHSVFSLCCDGSIVLQNLDGRLGNTADDQFRSRYAEDVRWGIFANDETRLLTLAASAESDNRFVAYWTPIDENQHQVSSRDYTLDELISLAHETLNSR